MRTGIATRRGRFFAAAVAAAVPVSALGVLAVLAGPPATSASDPCAASEVARTIGSVAKSMGDYLDSHPETNQAMTSMLQQQAGPQSLASMKSYFEANPKVAADLTSISQPADRPVDAVQAPDQHPAGPGLHTTGTGHVAGGRDAAGAPARGGRCASGAATGEHRRLTVDFGRSAVGGQRTLQSRLGRVVGTLVGRVIPVLPRRLHRQLQRW